ncbi:MAG TPA: adenylate kinase [Phycisphaerae bacterium]|jgi:adenylate kinase|nr:adenylate kinase [Phycisphaerae bacterium]HOJ55149.1 adenylate kinase [Phycisphaerae bacterium]HOL27351.1 adenylate kinase [Phycisphaerae bacterium]HPP20709.1 adenylate kinase [Phycisphaerae bacterium]HPU34126.1 adenylate kinase [Phycisphaerae bacterium]
MSAPADRTAWLQGGEAACKTYQPYPERAYRMVLLGAPGIGKGTQAELLCKRFRTCHLSTGDVFRAAKSSQGPLGPAMQAALGYMQRGELVPDETVIDMVRERVECLKCDYGFLLDGFPRTVQQAEALDRMFQETGLVLDAVLNYELPVEKVVERLSGRRTCKDCKTTFHVRTMPPKVEGKCDKCGGELYQREDDRPESIRVRLKAYEESTAPLKDYYAKTGLLITIQADGTPEQVFEQTIGALRDRGKA